MGLSTRMRVQRRLYEMDGKDLGGLDEHGDEVHCYFRYLLIFMNSLWMEMWILILKDVGLAWVSKESYHCCCLQHQDVLRVSGMGIGYTSGLKRLRN